MRYSKPVLTVMVVLMILSLNFSAAGAQGELPPLQDVFPPEQQEFAVDATNPYPISPTGDNYVFTRTPKFYFSRADGATRYQIQVRELFNPTVMVYTYTNTGTCAAGYCWIQPITKLKTFNNSIDQGWYWWKVRADVGGWGDWSAEEQVLVFSAGFNSTFDTNIKKWQQVSGSWTRVDPGYYKTTGLPDQIASVAQKEFYFDDYVYEVRMNSKNPLTNHFIVFEGTPGILDATNSWKNGYYLQYFNDGSWALTKLVNGVSTLLKSGVSPLINHGGWNTLTVWIDSPKIHMWVNGGYLGVVSDSSRYEGFVGFGVLKSGVDTYPFKVDYAKLYYTGVSPYAIPDQPMLEPSAISNEGE